MPRSRTTRTVSSDSRSSERDAEHRRPDHDARKELPDDCRLAEPAAGQPPAWAAAVTIPTETSVPSTL